MIERGSFFDNVKTSPEDVTPDERDALVMEAVDKLQKVEKTYQGKDEVALDFGDEPIWLIEAGDLHAGSVATDHRAIIDLRDRILSKPNIGLVLLGDEIEGLKKEYLDTNTARTPIDTHQQIDYLRNSFLGPLAKEKRILALVSGYWGHAGWPSDAATINTWIMMAQGLGIPILVNGGFLRLKFSNGYEHLKQVFHYPPRKSIFDTAFGLRNVAYSESEGLGRAQGYSKGHNHIAGIAKENYPGASIRPYFISSGTLKGSNLNLPHDRLGIKLGQPPTDPIGQGEVIVSKKGKDGSDRTYPVISFGHGEIIFEAANLLNRTEQQGMTKELTEKILQAAPKPEIHFIKGRSVTVRKPYDEMPENPVQEDGEPVYTREGLAPQYDTLFYDVRSSLPVTIHFIANTRLGSSYDGYEPLNKFMSRYIVKNPYAFTVFMRNMIDASSASKINRKEILQKYIDLIKSNGDQTLGFMLDENLRIGAWKKDKKKKGEEKSEGIPVATTISNATGARIIHHMSDISVAVGPAPDSRNKPVYRGVFADKLFRHGSYSRPTFGLRRIYDLYQAVKPGYVAGGHMPNSGIASFFDRGNPETNYPILIGTGWWAAYVDTAGRGNVSPGAVPCQAIVFIPGSSKGEYMSFPISNPDEADYIPKELTLLSGLRLLGIDPKTVTG